MNWASSEGFDIAKPAHRGPALLWLKDGGIETGGDRICILCAKTQVKTQRTGTGGERTKRSGDRGKRPGGAARTTIPLCCHATRSTSSIRRIASRVSRG
jgi:hypothetical protein